VQARAPRAGRYLPGLDGLRAIAVLLVLGFHLPYGRYVLADGPFRGGYLGVDVFFVLSGFLITSILVGYDGLNAASLRNFYERRIRRLLPALLVLVLACAVVAIGFQHGPERVATLKSIPATLGYWSNITAATAATVKTTILAHTWSLSIEFQYYVVWPIILLSLKRRLSPAQLLLLTLVGVQAVSAWRAIQFIDGVGYGRAYFATDTRVDALLIGSALGLFLWWKPAPRQLATRVIADALGIVALGGVVALATRVKFETPAMFERGGLTAVALLAVLVVHAVVVDPHGVCGSVLRLPPLVAIGKISYSLYLWHWPVIFVTAPVEPRWSFAVVTAIRVALSFGLATLSYFVVERVGRNRGAKAAPAPAPPPRLALTGAA